MKKCVSIRLLLSLLPTNIQYSQNVLRAQKLNIQYSNVRCGDLRECITILQLAFLEGGLRRN